MNNAEKFKQVFGLYATELWSMPESDFLAWLNRDVETTSSDKDLYVKECLDKAPTVVMEKPEAYHEEVTNQPSAQPERKAPISYEEQLSLDCSFCREHECGDTLYESSNWDGGIGFDFIRDIRFCPICGRKLYSDE